MVLGTLNDANGKLSGLAVKRLDLAFDLWSRDQTESILLTGGFGSHFNTTPKPHAYYAKQYLLNKGVNESSFLPWAESANTVEDAVKARPILAEYKIESITVVTSDFHEERARYVFKKALPHCKIEFKTAKTIPGNDISGETLAKLIKHEKEALNTMIKNGIYGI